MQPDAGLGAIGHVPDAKHRRFPCPQFFAPATDAVPTCRVAPFYAANHKNRPFTTVHVSKPATRLRLCIFANFII
jgi:hypothetical protein